MIHDESLQLIHCFCGYPGSVHDQRVFRVSEVHDMCSDHSFFPGDTHIIGDAAYAIQQHLLVPYKNNGRLTARQTNFNYCLSSARMAVERSIGLLKGRFRSLLGVLPMTRTDLIPKYIMACCVLHNVCLFFNDVIVMPIENGQIYLDERGRDNIDPLLRMQGIQKRLAITDVLPMRVND